MVKGLDTAALTLALNGPPTWRDRLQAPGGRIVAVIGAWALACGGWAAVHAVRPGGWSGDPGGLAVLPALVAVAILAWRASSHFDLSRHRRLGWRWFTTATVVYLLAASGTAALALLGEPLLPSPVDPLHLAFPVVLAIAWTFFLRSMRSERAGARFWLDAATVTLGGGVFFWLFVLEHVLALLPDDDGVALIVLARTGLGGACMLAAVLLVLRQTHWRERPALLYLAGGLFLLSAADLVGLVATLGGGHLPGSAAGLLRLFACAALAAGSHEEDFAASRLVPPQPDYDRRPWLVNLVPFVALALAAVALLSEHTAVPLTRASLLVLVVCAAFVLVLVRQALASREIADLEARLAVRAAEMRFASLVRHSADVIALTDESGVLRSVSAAAERVLGVTPAAAIGRPLAELLAVEDRPRVREFFGSTLHDHGAAGTLEARVATVPGARPRVVEITGTNLAGDAAVDGCVLNVREVTERKALEAQLKRLAFHDPLTLLANRALFRDRVDHAVSLSRRTGRRIAVMFVDLDNFKQVNDVMGHGEGDRLLRNVAQRLVKCTRSGDTVARLGGDEFAVLVEDATRREQVLEAAGRIVEALRIPVVSAGTDIRVAASVGIAFASRSDGVDDVLRNADIAMYHAKSMGKGRYAVFEEPMQQALRDRARMESDLAHAVTRGEFQLQYQPIVDLESGYLLGVEALVRWRHPERGLVQPGEFIGIAEDTGHVIALGRWVLREACREVRSWQERLPKGRQVRVAVNVSGRHLQTTDFERDVLKALEESRLDPECLVIEMTESVIMQNTEAMLRRLQQLKRLGVRIAIDDFGTGYSSLSYLHRFPIDILKIDRSFVQLLDGERDGAELARAVITLGEALGLEVVAEGIENEPQQRELRALGCVAGQGFYYSKPALLREIELSIPMQRRRAVVESLAEGASSSATGRFRMPDPATLEAVAKGDLPIELFVDDKLYKSTG